MGSTHDINPKTQAEREAERKKEMKVGLTKDKTEIGSLTGTGAGIAAGAAIGSIVPGVGTVVGAVAGALAGGLAGAGIGAVIDAKEHEAYWRKHYTTRPYAESLDYDTLAPAYRLGWEARARSKPDARWDEMEPTLSQAWAAQPASAKLEWERARHASRDAWDRVDLVPPNSSQVT